ncbi:restriction endonuclease subunit S [Xanthomonas euvesicatoria]|uniref:restriction endonuclease subunit S n=1 Tax=Xanthomonas euvesicatoria TaxID=456327 RepID=UPI0035561869
MSELPAGWATFSIADIGGLAGGKTPSKANPAFWSSRDVPWISPKDMKKLYLEDSEDRISKVALSDAGMALYPAKSILMVTRSGILQHTFPVALARVDSTVNQDIKVIAPHSEIDTIFLLYSLRAFGQIILQRCSKAGTTVQSIDSDKLEAFPFPLPPLAEQKRIAQELDALLAQVDTLKARIDAIPALLKRFRQSTLAAAFSARLTGEAPAEFDHWQEAKFSSVIEDLRYGTAQKCDYNGGTTGVLRIPNIGDRGIVLSDMKSSDFSETEIKKLELMKGDIVLIRSNGSVELVGKSALVSEKEQGLLFAGYLIRVRLDQAKSIPEFVNYWLKSPAIRQVIEQIARSTSGVNNINSEEIKSLTFTFPSLSAQAEIVRRVEQLFAYADQLEAKVAAAQQRIDALTQSLLAKAFRGELVPQDPTDEPASVLLARIRTQRAATPKPKRGRKKV